LTDIKGIGYNIRRNADLQTFFQVLKSEEKTF